MSARTIYPAAVAARARELGEAEWGPTAAKAVLEREFGVSPSKRAVACWMDPERARRWSAKNNAQRQAAKLDSRGWERSVSPEVALERMRVMRVRGMTYRCIAIAAGVWWGERITEEQVRERLRGLVPKNPNMARRPRATA
jgi:hypothetical protein